MKDASVPHPPTILNADGFTFQLIKKIGEGGFARCYEAIELTSSRKYAIKAIFIDAVVKMKAKSKLLNEIDIHYRLDHRHVVKLYRFFKDEQFIYLVLELCENKTLVDLVRSRKVLSEYEARYYIWMILLAVNHLHSSNIIHRDLKLGNVFLNLENDVKIGDFGLATTLDQVGDRKKTICGTPNYIAPEILFDKERGHSFEVDIWAVGIILYTILYGKPPFQSSEVKAIYKNIKHNNYIFPPDIMISDAAKDLIRLILTNDPEKRPKLENIFEHEFFSSIMMKELPFPVISNFKNQCLNVFIQREKALLTAAADATDNKENIPALENAPLQPTPRAKISLAPQQSAKDQKKVSVFSSTYQTLSRYLDNRAAGLPRSSLVHPASEPAMPAFYIEKWIDYTSKYGIGYLCSNGNVGAYFNDGTSLIINSSARVCEYLSPDSAGAATSKSLSRTFYSLDSYPPDLTKKATIIGHFSVHFEKNTDMNGFSKNSTKNMDVILKYAKVDNAIVFRLSTRSIQIIFDDNLSMISTEDGNVLTLLDLTLGDKQAFWLSSLASSSFMNSEKLYERLDSFRRHLGTFLQQK